MGNFLWIDCVAYYIRYNRFDRHWLGQAHGQADLVHGEEALYKLYKLRVTIPVYRRHCVLPLFSSAVCMAMGMAIILCAVLHSSFVLRFLSCSVALLLIISFISYTPLLAFSSCPCL